MGLEKRSKRQSTKESIGDITGGAQNAYPLESQLATSQADAQNAYAQAAYYDKISRSRELAALAEAVEGYPQRSLLLSVESQKGLEWTKFLLS